MNKYLAPFFYTLLIFASCWINITSSFASVTWHAFCSNITTDSFEHNTSELQATNYTITIPSNPNVYLKSQQLHVSQNNKNLSQDQLQRITNITSTSLLTLFLNYQINECNKRYYVDTVKPILKQLRQNGQLTFIWKNITLKNAKVAYKADELQLQFLNISNNVNIKLHFSGLTEIYNVSQNNIFLPKNGDANLTTSTENFPFILAAASGNNENSYYNLTLPLTINHLMINNNLTYITASGNTILDKKLNPKAAKGKVTVSNMEKLISKSNSAYINKIKTALILAKFAGRSVGNNTMEWDINWQGNLFKVNNIPIPIW